MSTKQAKQLKAARLSAHGLSQGFATPAAVVAQLGCVQAQDLAAAKWALGVRTTNALAGDVDHALTIDRTIVRSWPMRGTLQLTTPQLLRPFLVITAERVLRKLVKRHHDLEITDQVYGRARQLAITLLSGGHTASRKRLQDSWDAAGIPTAGQRGYHLILRLALEGILCCADLETPGQQRFALLDEWSPATENEPTDREEILGQLFVIYARGHGPIAIRDFAWWLGITQAEARLAANCAADRVAVFDADRFVVADFESEQRLPDVCSALPMFDEYYLGYSDRSVVCHPDFYNQVVPGANGQFLPTLSYRGDVIGTWKRAPERGGLTAIKLSWFANHSGPTKNQKSQKIRKAFTAWARFNSLQLGEIIS